MSFFATDKDLSKVPSRKANSTSSRGRMVPGATAATGVQPTIKSSSLSISSTLNSNNHSLSSPISNVQPDSKDDIINIARQERESRQQLKKQNAVAIQIQAWYRGRSACKHFFYSQQDALNSQLQDIAKVRSLLQSKQQVFVVPLNVAVNQLTQLLVILKYAQKQPMFQTIFNSYCVLVLIPSSETTDPSKNIVHAECQSKNGLRRLRTLLSAVIHSIMTRKNDPATLVILSNTINALLFDKNNDNKHISASKMHLRSAWFGQHLLPEVRSMIIRLSAPVSVMAIDELDDFQSVKEKISKSFTGISNAISILFSIAKRIVLVEGPDEELKFVEFVKELLTIPFLSILLHDSQIVTLVIEDKIIDRLITLFPTVNTAAAFKITKPKNLWIEELEQGVDNYDVSELQYLIANVISLFNSSLISKLLDAQESFCHEQVKLLSQFLVAFVDKVYISDISNEALKISWKVSGSRMLAMEKPKLFVLQYTVILDRLFLGLLMDHSARPDITASSCPWQTWVLAKDETDVTTALASSSSTLVNKRLQDSHSSWFGSSWATKLGLSSMGSLLSSGNSVLNKSKEGSGIMSWFSSFRTKNVPTGETSASSKAASFVLDQHLFTQVVRLLALVLSPASNTKYTSKSWKAVSVLTYSRPMLLLLWFKIQQDHKGFEDICSKFNPEEVKNYTLLSDTFCTLACFLSCLKVYLISLDDIELYDQQV
jgi:hypothetical protein